MPDSFDYLTNSEDDAPSYTKETNSRNANILKSIINNTEYTDAPQSEIEELLLELKEKIAGGGGGGRYSTDEQVVGTWIDGSPLYQRTFHKTITNENDYIDLNRLGIDTVIFQEGYLVDDESNYKQVINAPYYNNGNYYCRLYFVTNGYAALGSDYPSNPILFIESSSDSIRYYDELIITLKYTKATV